MQSNKYLEQSTLAACSKVKSSTSLSPRQVEENVDASTADLWLALLSCHTFKLHHNLKTVNFKWLKYTEEISRRHLKNEMSVFHKSSKPRPGLKDGCLKSGKFKRSSCFKPIKNQWQVNTRSLDEYGYLISLLIVLNTYFWVQFMIFYIFHEVTVTKTMSSLCELQSYECCYLYHHVFIGMFALRRRCKHHGLVFKLDFSFFGFFLLKSSLLSFGLSIRIRLKDHHTGLDKTVSGIFVNGVIDRLALFDLSKALPGTSKGTLSMTGVIDRSESKTWSCQSFLSWPWPPFPAPRLRWRP